MLIGLTTILILVFFGGGTETAMLNPDMKKNVHTYVTDKERVKEIDHAIKDIEKKQKHFQKKTKKDAVNKFKKLNTNPQSTREEFEYIIGVYTMDLQALHKQYLDDEMKIRSLITETEWNQIMEKVLTKPDREKDKKQLDKASQDIYNHLIKACEKSIKDTNELSKSKLYVKEYKTKTDSMIVELLEQNYKNQESIQKYDAPRENFEVLSARMLVSKKTYLNYLVDMRFKLKSLTSEKEWKSLAKELNKMLGKVEKM